MSVHPEVNQYISEMLQSLKLVLQKGEAEAVVFAVMNQEQKPVERFVFEIAPPSTSKSREDMYLLRVEQALRGFLLKLNVCEAMLQENPPDCSWMVQVHTKDSTMLDLQTRASIQDFTWVEADEDQVKMKDAHLLPLKAMDTGGMKMQLYVEEMERKS